MGVHFSPKKGQLRKIVEEGCYGRVTFCIFGASLCVYKSKKYYNSRYLQQ